MKRTIRNLALSLALVGGTLWGVAAPPVQAQDDCYTIMVCVTVDDVEVCFSVTVCV